jgi:feruloyl esterase
VGKIAFVLGITFAGLAFSIAGAAKAEAIGAMQYHCAENLRVAWPDPSTRVERAAMVMASGTGVSMIPAHCEMFGIMHERVAADGQNYAIRFHLRMPYAWNGKFFFQGGGGTNGEIGDALGRVLTGPPSTVQEVSSALTRGYAVVSQDSGHDNRLNNDPKRGGTMVFGFDPQARADYGHASLAPVANAAKAVITAYYGKPIKRSYFLGCSKGGEEGMVFAQQHPNIFDGIVAGAPGFALPRAALEQTLDVKLFAQVVRLAGQSTVSFMVLHNAFSAADMKLVGTAVLDACDALDGLTDGLVSNFRQCTAAKVKPQLVKRNCAGAKNDACLSVAQTTALLSVMAGARTSDGKLIYSSWAWDAGIAGDGWRAWKIGSADGHLPPINVLIGASLPAVFSVPPTALPGDPQASMNWQLAFDANRDSKRIYATGGGFRHSAWADVSAHSSDLAAFKAHGGKLIVPHGVSDPVFSINDTIDWYNRVNARNHGKASAFVRVFPVPGMAHCGGGPATDRYDALAVLEGWVEKAQAPDRIIAKADAQSPWPQRTRPLCAYPQVAIYNGGGSIDDAANFTCAIGAAVRP